MLRPTRTRPALAAVAVLITLAALPTVSQAALSEGLVAYWNFDGDVSATAGGPSYDAIEHNGPLSFDPGRFGSAAHFTRSLSQYLEIAAPVITQGQDHTYSAWYKSNIADITGGDRYFVLETTGIGGASAVSVSYGLRDAGGEDVGQVYSHCAGGDAPNAHVPGAAGTGWHNIIVMYDADHTGLEHLIYLDGEPLFYMPSCSLLMDTAGLIIGSYRDGDDRYWDGLIDDVAFWDRVLTTWEVAAIQRGPVLGSFTDIEAGLTDVYSASVAWGDYDNDGDLDILLTGSTGTEYISRVYGNDAGTFTDVEAGLEGVAGGSVAWGDYDNDGDLDILLTGGVSPGRISRVYENDAGTFTDIDAGLTDAFNGSVAWGDYDNDGDLDILLTGATDSGRISRVYENDAGTFTDIDAELTGVYAGSVAWGDYDNDGDLDILLTGQTDAYELISPVYENDAGTFTDIEAGLEEVYESSASWGDYDNDGDLDILLMGRADSEYISRVYENDAGTFTDIEAGLTDMAYGSAAWGDYDNDGDLDILLTGATGPEFISRVYGNDAGTFTDIEAGLEGAAYGSVAWGDYDNDGDLEILLTGAVGPAPEYISRVYEYDDAIANTAPAAPSNLSFDLAGSIGTFSWDAATDNETPSAGLTYNLRIGTTPGGDEICSGMADAASGYRRVVQMGNSQQRTSWAVILPPGQYYWSVQALDGAFEGSAFAEEQSCVVLTFTDIEAGLTGVAYSSVAWGDYDNDGDLDILMTGGMGGPGQYISRVYENDAGTFTDIVAGLTGVRRSSAAWGDYDNDGDLDILLTGYTGSEGISRVYENDAGTFTDIAAGLTGVYWGSAAWGDYDNDGDLDILMMGVIPPNLSVSFLYSNDGDGQFTSITTEFPGLNSSSVAWGDYDNDGDLDILMTGFTGIESVSHVYENDAGTFTDIDAGLPEVYGSSVAWGDYDNDGDLDILMTGYTDLEQISRVYENNAGTFTDIEAGLDGVFLSSAAWGDYDNDGDLDILMAGEGESGNISRVYENDAGTFTDIGAGLPGVASFCSVAWGDYDSDGDLDILLTGDTDSGPVSHVYESNGAPANTTPAAPSDLSFAFTEGVGTFSWEAATDSETPSAGLTYNLRVGTTPGGDEICSGMADAASGYRRVVQLGNAQQRTSWTVTLALGNYYYWSVQALDGAFAGSAFATEQSSLAIGFTDIAAGLPGASLSSVAWGDYDNDGDLDILMTGDTGSGYISGVYENDAGTFTDIAAGLEAAYNGPVAWGDYDNDGDLDILMTGDTGSEYVSRIYRNDAGTFTDIAAGLPGMSYSSAAWGDYDNDGDLDILLAGLTDSACISRIYRNDGDGTFADIAAGLDAACTGSVAWGDYDNDGDLDILLTGHNSSQGSISRVYENDAGTFTDIDAGLPAIYYSSVAWGDYDNDGDLDILMTGDAGFGSISRVYENDAGTFTDIAAGLEAASDGAAAWGDYDNDGDLDILLTGYTDARVYGNDAGTFTDIAAGLPGVYESSAAWGDYDSDGDLDILLTGSTGSEDISRVYESNGAPANTAPTPPTNLAFDLVGNVGTFSWDAATDNESPSAGLTYNLRIGTTPGGDEICSCMADSASGYRRLPQLGNTNHNTTWAITLPEQLPHWVYWSVQAVDGTLEGSAFASTDVIETGVAHPEDDALPTALRLYPSAPNPFNPRTMVRYDLPTKSPVRIAIYDAVGRHVVTLVDEPAHAPGRHEAVWDGRSAGGQGVASGIYFCRMESGEFREVRKMALVR